MTQQEIIERLKQDRAAGLTYKWIAAQIGLKTQCLYEYKRYISPPAYVHEALEKYYAAREEKNNGGT